MFKLRKYYLPHLGAIALALLLLFIQANLELALPDYLSKIVNVGIQQGGIESALPENLDREQYAQIKADTNLAPVLSAAYEEDGTSYRLTDRGRAVLEKDNIKKYAFLRACLAAAGADPGRLQSLYILRMGAIMLALTLASALTTISVGFIAARVSASVARDIRLDLFRRVESFSSTEFDTFSTASLITRSTNDITQIQMVSFMIIRMALYAPIMGVGGVIRALGKAPSMAWIIGVAVLFLLSFVGLIMSMAMPRFKIMQKLVDNLNRVSREQLSGLLVVRAFNRQDFERDRFDAANKELADNNLFVMRTMVIMMPAITLIMNGLSVAVIWVGSGKVAAAQMPIGDMMAFLQYAVQIVMSFLMLSMMFIMIPRAAVSAERVAEVLGTEPVIFDPEKAESPPMGGKTILEFRNVDFSYPGGEERALSGISFTAEPGKTTAVIGSTGSGKSTLVNLIPRFYDVTGGEILLNGVDVRRLKQEDLRRRIGLVPQKASLFSGTVASNLRYGDESAGEEKLNEVCETAQVMDFIREGERGFERPVSQGGSNFSGGQKQRLSIARALVKPADVLIFDDSFSALDFKTDRALRRSLKESTADRVTLIVAQRVSTIMNADQILVLDEGKLTGKGTHRELMEHCPTYREIVLSQLSLEEAENL
ncbi:MAG: ABC transporter ATP-binding protein [Spirochaetales bacterium]|nr:ABC transporter ATP-binding protein [Spirochaetales bacterium]